MKPIALLAVAAVLACPGIGRAQDLDSYFPLTVPGYDRERGVTVLSRLRPLYEEYGIRAGSFVIHPRLDEAFGYDSNLSGTGPGQASLVLRTAPSVSARSDWSRDSLGASLAIDDYWYWDAAELYEPRSRHRRWLHDRPRGRGGRLFASILAPACFRSGSHTFGYAGAFPGGRFSGRVQRHTRPGVVDSLPGRPRLRLRQHDRPGRAFEPAVSQSARRLWRGHRSLCAQ